LDGPVLVIVIQAVGVAINVLIDFEVFEHRKLAAASDDIGNWVGGNNVQEVDEEAEEENSSAWLL
jgi:hypothetical protein